MMSLNMDADVLRGDGFCEWSDLLRSKAPVTKVCSANFALLLNDFFMQCP